MRIYFILTDSTKNIVGGYKIVYIYANELANIGYDVEIIYRCYQEYDGICKKLINYLYRYMYAKMPIAWFKLSKNIKRKLSFGLKKDISNSIIFATACSTAEEIHRLGLDKSNKILYLIQDYETWTRPEKFINNTFKYFDYNIVIAKWLEKIVNIYSKSKAIYIPNGINTNIFYCKTQFLKRRRHSIAMLYHTQERKGAKEGLKAIFIIKEIYPDLTVDLFGSPDRPKDLPKWINYKQNANQTEVANIYNRNCIYLMPSRREGFGLPGLEALACGCVLVTTPCQGVDDYAVNGVNAVVMNGFAYGDIVESIKMCFESWEMMISLSNNAEISGRKFSMKKSCEKVKLMVNKIALELVTE